MNFVRTNSRIILFAKIGLVLGVLYSFGGAVYDFFTTGLNGGTALAFLALIGMPFIFALIGLVVGVIESILRS